MSTLQTIQNTPGAFIIAEVGVNYYDHATELGISNMEAAKRMIDEAAGAGAHAVKFQSYKAATLASRNSPAYWDQSEEPTDSQFALFSKFDSFGEAEYQELARYCEEVGVVFLSTAFDYDSADYLDALMPFYKISSSDLTNLPFVEHQARKGKPILLSTGAATLGEIEAAVAVVEGVGNHDICLMHCVLDYPTDFEDANLNMIKHLAAVFPDKMIGYSDHTRPDPSMLTVTTAYIFGATIIEKHFTLNKSLQGNDHYHAMDPADLARFSANIKLYETIGGQYQKAPLPCEAESRKQARRSIVTAVDIAAGEELTREKLTFKRPGTGISPTHLDVVLGRRAQRDLPEDTLIDWSDV